MSRSKRPAVLIVDDQPAWRHLLAELLDDDYEVVSVATYEEANSKLLDQDPPFHVAVIDIRLVDEDPQNEQGIRLIEKLNDMGQFTNAIAITGFPTVRTARETLNKLDAYDYIEKAPENGEAFDHRRFQKIVQEAVYSSEKRWPDRCTRKSNSILVSHTNPNRGSELARILRDDNYQVRQALTVEEILQNLDNQIFNLLLVSSSFLLEDRRLLTKIRKRQSDIGVIIVTDVEAREIVHAFRDDQIIDIVSIRKDNFRIQELRESVRRSFAPEAVKYLLLEFEEADSLSELKAEWPYTLTLNLYDKQKAGALSVWLPPQAYKKGEMVFRVSIDASGMKLLAEDEILWRISFTDTNPQLRVKVIPQSVGDKLIVINVKYGARLLRQLRKEVKILEKE